MKILRGLYIFFFIGICFSLFVLMPFSKSDMKVEKREASGFPKIKKEDGKLNMDYFDELTDYFTDNFAFRQELATADAIWKSKLLGSSNNQKAVVGKNEWLYFNGSLNDYLGRELLNEREVYAASKTISLMQEYTESKNCSFIFTVAPNKNTLYPKNMPDNYLAAEGDTNIEHLRDQMNKTQVNSVDGTPEAINYVDLQEAFLSQDKVLYHKWDSHWNNEGATFACDKLLTSIGKEHYDYMNEPYTIEKNHKGDLWQLIYPSWNKMDENVIYQKEHEYTYVNPVESVEDMFIMTSCPGKDGSVVMFRDSFGNALLPYVADEYGNGLFLKGMPLNVKQVELSGATTLIYEVVERNIPNIIAYLPVMDAPYRGDDIGQIVYEATGEDASAMTDVTDVTDSNTTMEYEDKVQQLVVYGKIDPEYVETDSDIFIKLTKPDGTESYFEATPASYEKREDGDDLSDYYGAYLNKEDAPSGSTAEVLISKNGGIYTTKKIVLEYN